MGIFQITLLAATLLCALVAGLLFAFAVVIMPGLATLGDGEFLRGFQVIDRVIQNNQPIFLLVWLGSAVVLLASAVLGFGQLDGVGRMMLVAAAVVYIVGVQVPTVAINVPLNNRVQTLQIDTMDETALRAARQEFEPRWVRWNSIRTLLASLVTLTLLVLLVRI